MEAKIEQPNLNSLGVTDDEAKQIGLRLKEKREQNQQSSIEKISTRLKINRTYIEIIESGDWDSLPQSANGRGFVRLYAKELEVPIPEFEKFLDAKLAVTAETKVNLDKIVACAREKGLMHMNSYQSMLAQSGTVVKNLFSSKKKLLVMGSLGIVVMGTTVLSLVLSQYNSSDDVNSSQIALSEEEPLTSTEMVQNAPTEIMQNAPTETASVSSAPTETASAPTEAAIVPAEAVGKPAEKPIASAQPTQKMQVEILFPVSMHIETDGKQVVDGLTQPGTLNLEFKNKALLIIEDSSKVKLSYAGWEHELLSVNTRKRIIALNAQPFEI